MDSSDLAEREGDWECVQGEEGVGGWEEEDAVVYSSDRMDFERPL